MTQEVKNINFICVSLAVSNEKLRKHQTGIFEKYISYYSKYVIYYQKYMIYFGKYVIYF